MKGLLLLSLICVCLYAFAQPAAQRTITVRVLDGETKKPIRDAMVVVPGRDVVKSNAVGFFQMAIDTVKQFFVKHPAYETSKVAVPEAGQFSILLTPIWFKLPVIPHAMTNVKDPKPYQRLDSLMPYVRYKGGWIRFYEQLSTALHTRIHQFKPDSIVRILFVVDARAGVSGIRVRGAKDSVLMAVTNVLGGVADWEFSNPSYPIWRFDVEADEKVFHVEEVSARPVNGMQAFYAEIGRNMKYPKDALRNNIEGRVQVTFNVEADGSLTNCKVDKGLGYGCDEEAIRLISVASKWIPGSQKGKPVRQRYTLPIIFKSM